MAKKEPEYRAGQRIKVDGVTAVILDVLSSQLFVEFDNGKEGVQGFIILRDHKVEVE